VLLAGFAAEALRRLALPTASAAAAAAAGAWHGSPPQLECAATALNRFVASARWKPPEMAGAMGLRQDHYDYTQGLFVMAA
jgi:hypothetical protein